ncbi:hypothetical protein KIPB_011759 [Kipferlia bialata]|uniref:Uncharacterized protein n=1 Tax=Kipferlia bialata TaxID=797122 RepID=A0A9K3GNH2_9EUKA|nr:hypothetical protein KIPB_011759 [Kipferlia bialata]|eukprot:g11759.t1
MDVCERPSDIPFSPQGVGLAETVAKAQCTYSSAIIDAISTLEDGVDTLTDLDEKSILEGLVVLAWTVWQDYWTGVHMLVDMLWETARLETLSLGPATLKCLTEMAAKTKWPNCPSLGPVTVGSAAQRILAAHNDATPVPDGVPARRQPRAGLVSDPSGVLVGTGREGEAPEPSPVARLIANTESYMDAKQHTKQGGAGGLNHMDMDSVWEGMGGPVGEGDTEGTAPVAGTRKQRRKAQRNSDKAAGKKKKKRDRSKRR